MCSRSTDIFVRFISWFSTIAITIGVMALITVLSVMNGFEHELESNVLTLMPQVLLTSAEWRLDPKRVPSSVLNALEGVTHVSSLVTDNVVLQSTCSVTMGVMLGINPTDPEPLLHYPVDARQDDLIAGQYRVILGKKLATALSVKRGDTVRLMVLGTNQFTPIGRISSQRLFTVIGTFAVNNEVDSYQLIINQQDASHLMRYPTGYITGWRLWLQQPLKVDELSAQPLPDGLVWHDWREHKGELFHAIRMEKNMMGLLLSLIVIIASFNIITSLGLLIMEKQPEIAILQTQGLTYWQVILIFISQGTAAGIIGALLGAGLGVLLSNQLNRLMSVFMMLFDGVLLPVVIEPLQVMIVILSTIVMTILSTIYPSWIAATIHPAKALRYE